MDDAEERRAGESEFLAWWHDYKDRVPTHVRIVAGVAARAGWYASAERIAALEAERDQLRASLRWALDCASPLAYTGRAYRCRHCRAATSKDENVPHTADCPWAAARKLIGEG